MGQHCLGPSGFPVVVGSEEINGFELHPNAFEYDFVHQNQAGTEVAELLIKCEFGQEVYPIVRQAIVECGGLAVESDPEQRQPFLVRREQRQTRVKRAGLFILIARRSISALPTLTLDSEEIIEHSSKIGSVYTLKLRARAFFHVTELSPCVRP